MSTPRTKYEYRRARQPHRCTECRGNIEVKTVYLFTAMPPEHEFNASKPRRWYCKKVCPGCMKRGNWTEPQPRAGKGVT